MPAEAAVFAGALALLLIIWVAARICRIYTPQLPRVELDDTAAGYVGEATRNGRLSIVASQPQPDGHGREAPQPEAGTMLLLEIGTPVRAGRAATLTVTGQRRDGQYLLRAEAWDVADAIAAVLLHLRDRTGLTPHVHFCWPARHPLAQFGRFLLLGNGEVILLTRQLLYDAEPDPARRPTVHVG